MTILCRTCRRSNDPWRRFCGGCGSNLPGGCTHCGVVNKPDDKFCGGCARAQRATTKQHQETTPIDIIDVLGET
jgi:Double zinc ribbon